MGRFLAGGEKRSGRVEPERGAAHPIPMWPVREERARVRIDIREGDFWSTTAVLTVNSQKDETAVFVADELGKQLRGMKPPYDLLARTSLYVAIMVSSVAFLLILGSLMLFGVLPHESLAAHEHSYNLYSFAETFSIIAFIVIAIAPLEIARSWLFPRVFLMIGEQKKKMETIRKYREWLFVGLLLAVVGSLAAGLILRYLA